MGQQARDVGVVEDAASLPRAAAVLLQVEQPLDEGAREALAEGVTHRDVHAARIRGQGVEQGREQVLVGEHHSRLAARRTSARRTGKLLDDACDVLALHGVGRGGHDREPLVAAEGVVADRGGGRKGPQVVAHEESRLLCAVLHVVGVVVPVEIGLFVGREVAEEPLLAHRQGVESRHHVAARAGERTLARGQALDRRALDQSRVAHAQGAQPLAEPAVDRGQRAPHVEEAPLLLRQVAVAEQLGPERPQDAHLLGREVREVGLQLLQVGDVAEEPVGVDQVFVHRVEVAQQRLAPEIEAVEGLGMVLRVDLVEFGHHAHVVARAQSRRFGRQFVDGHPLGAPQGPLGHARQRVEEEDTRALRRKEDRELRDPRTVAGVEVGRHLVEKTFHRTGAISPPVKVRSMRSTEGVPE